MRWHINLLVSLLNTSPTAMGRTSADGLFGLFFASTVKLAPERKLANSCGALPAARIFMTCRKEVEIGVGRGTDAAPKRC